MVLDLLDASPNPVLGCDADGVVDYANDRALALFGYSREELLGSRVERLVPPDSAAGHVELRERFVAQGDGRAFGAHPGLEAQLADGTVVPIDASLTPLETPSGRWTVAAVRDLRPQRATEERLESLSRAYLTLALISQVTVEAKDVDRLYADVCRIAVDLGGFRAAWVGAAHPSGEVVRIASAGGLEEYIDRLHITTDPDHPMGQGPTGRALRDGKTCYSHRYLEDESTAPWHALGRQYGVRASVTLPLRRHGRTVAGLTFYSDVPDLFDDQMQTLLESTASHVSLALDALWAGRELQEVSEQRAELLRRLVIAQEEERTRIANDVHDGPVQAMAALDLRLGMLLAQVQATAPGLAGSVEQLQQTVASVTSDLRHLLADLEPVPATIGPVEMLRETSHRTLLDTPVAWTVRDESPVPGELPDQVESTLLQANRIAQEALINVRKHARATSVEVTLLVGRSGLTVTIADDGIGLGADEPVSRPGHRGLAAMRDRASLAGGWCTVDSTARGTTVRYHLPWPAPAVS